MDTIFVCLVHILLKSKCHEVRGKVGWITLALRFSDVFSNDFGQSTFEQFYAVCGTYGHVMMTLIGQ